MESIGVAGEFLSQAIVVFLALRFFQQFGVSFTNDLLQVAPSVLERLHSEPSVRIGPDFEALDFCIQSG